MQRRNYYNQCLSLLSNFIETLTITSVITFSHATLCVVLYICRSSLTAQEMHQGELLSRSTDETVRLLKWHNLLQTLLNNNDDDDDDD